MRVGPCLLFLAALLVACSGGGETSAGSEVAPRPETRLLEALGARADVAAGGPSELFGADLSLAPAAPPEGWQRFERVDPRGEQVVTLVRVVETRGGDLEYEADVQAGPVALRLAHVPAGAGDKPASLAELKAWFEERRAVFDLREVRVAAGEPAPPLATLPEKDGLGQPSSTRVILAFDYLGPTARVGRISLRHLSNYELEDKSRVVAAPDFSGGPIVGEVNLAGDLRRALVLPLGTRRELELPGAELAGRTRLDLAVGPLLGTSPPELGTAALGVRIERGGEALVDELVELDPLGQPADRHWRSLSISLDPAWAEGSVGLSLEARATDGRAERGRALAVAGLTLTGGEAARKEAPRFNLFLVSLDTVRADFVGRPGARASLTPRLDAFSKEALCFERTESVAPFTLPTHGSVFTGLLPTVHGATKVGKRLGADRPLVAELLRDAGWSTAAFTGGGFLSPDFGFVRGFSRYTVHDPLMTTEGLPPLEERRGDAARGLSQIDWDNQLRLEAAYGLKWPRVSSWLDEKASAPKFLFLHTYAAHQYLVPQRIYDEELAGTRSQLTQGPALGTLTRRRFKREPPSAADIEHLRRLYGAAVRSADDGFGRFLDDLEARGLDKTSFVVVFSDHGEELFEHGEFGHSHDLSQELLAVPLMIRGPGIEPGRIAEPVSLLDLGPTLLALLGQPPVEGFTGRSLVAPRPGGFEVAPHVAHVEAGLFSEVSQETYFKDSLLVWPFKLVRDYGTEGRGESFVDHLYALDQDPGETLDQSAANPELAERMARELTAWRARVDAQAAGEQSSADLSDETQRQLKDLGYL